MLKRVLLLFALAVVSLGIIACGSKNEDHTVRDAALLAAIVNQNPTLPRALSAEEQLAQTAAVAVANVSSGAQQGGGMTVLNDRIGSPQMLASIMENGFDPVHISNLLQKKRDPRVADGADDFIQEAALTAVSTGSSSWTFDGTLDGYDKGTTIYDIGTAIGIGVCNVTLNSPGSTPTGSVTFSNGIMAYSGSGSGLDYTGSSLQTADVTFSDYGTMYTDWYELARMFKSPPTTTVSNPPTCPEIQESLVWMNNILSRHAIIKSGDLNYTVRRQYVNSSTADGLNSDSTYNTTLNAPGGIVVQDDTQEIPGPDQTLVIENLNYGYSSSFQVSDPASPNAIVSGSMSITINGMVNGVILNTDVAVSF